MSLCYIIINSACIDWLKAVQVYKLQTCINDTKNRFIHQKIKRFGGVEGKGVSKKKGEFRSAQKENSPTFRQPQILFHAE